jgi:hypothetical protein
MFLSCGQGIRVGDHLFSFGQKNLMGMNQSEISALFTDAYRKHENNPQVFEELIKKSSKFTFLKYIE